MGTDQGKTSNVNALAIMAACAALTTRRPAPPPSARPSRR
jgi:hypothetical protein